MISNGQDNTGKWNMTENIGNKYLLNLFSYNNNFSNLWYAIGND